MFEVVVVDPRHAVCMHVQSLFRVVFLSRIMVNGVLQDHKRADVRPATKSNKGVSTGYVVVQTCKKTVSRYIWV